MTNVVVSLSANIREIQARKFGSVTTSDTDYTLTAGAATLTGLDPSGVDWCWVFTEHGPGGRIRYCAVPDVASVAYADLVDVDPGSLLPVVEPADPAWAIGLSAVEADLADEVALRVASDAAAPIASQVTQGLYARTVPTPDSGASILPMCADPNNAGYVWAIGQGTGKLGYTANSGATFTPVTDPPSGGGVSGMSICQIRITSGVPGGDFMFAVMSSTAPNQGQVWRSPAPNATGSNIAWTQIFGYDTTTHLINGPGGASGSSTGNGENLRNSSFEITPDGAHAYILPYSAGLPTIGVATRSDGAMAAGSPLLTLPISQAFQGWNAGGTITVTGAGAGGALLSTKIDRIWSVNCAQLTAPAQTSVSGATVTFQAPNRVLDIVAGPTLRVCHNPCAADPASVLWAAGKVFPFARHGHSVRVINGVPWVSNGDYGFPQDLYGDPPITNVGVYAGLDTGGINFNARLLAKGVTPWDCINIYPITIDGKPMVIGESDSGMSTGPILIPTQSSSGTIVQARLLHQSVPPVVGTMRCLAICPTTGNIYYLATSESGVAGPVDAVVMSAPPYTVPIILETFAPNTLGSVFDAVIDGPYVWFGKSRLARERIKGQS